MREMEKDTLLNVLRLAVKENKEIFTNDLIAKADCDRSLFDEFEKGYDMKMLCYNSNVDTLLIVKTKLQAIGIRYETREYSITEKKKDYCGIEYDFYLKMTDEEYNRLCEYKFQ